MKIFIVLFLLSSCINQGIPSFREYFDNDMISHFPDSDASRIAASYFYPQHKSFYNLGVYLRETYECSIKNIDSLVYSLEKSNAVIVKHKDSCNLFIELYYNHGLNKNTTCSDIIPVPNFWEEIISLPEKDIKHLPDDFTLYLIEFKKGKFIDEYLLNNDAFKNTEWKNGISKGVAISRKRRICIFWLEIW